MAATLTPQAPDAEFALIGAMLLSPVALETAVTMLTDDDFYDPRWRRAFTAMDRLWRVGEPVDPVSVHAEVERLGFPEMAVDLVSAQANVPATSNAARYCHLVADAAGRRRIQGFAEQLRAAASSGEQLADELVSSAREEIEGLDTASGVAVPEGSWELSDFLDDVEATPTPWIIPDVVKQDWRVIVVAPEGSGKTVLLRQLAVASSVGIHPFTYKRIEPTRALIIDLENPRDSINLICRPMVDHAKANGIYEYGCCRLWWRPDGINLDRRRDRVDLENEIRLVRPNLVCMGPIKNCYKAGAIGEEAAAGHTQEFLSSLRIRYQFALVLEGHAPHGESGHREMRPKGSTLWKSWPEMGIGMTPIPDEPNVFTLARSRGDRMPNNWPQKVEHSGGPWPWRGIWPTGGLHRNSEPARDDSYF